MNQRRLIYYLLLNIFVSACVTTSIIFWYDRNVRAVQPAVQQVVTTGDAAPTANLQSDIPVRISSVVGAGSLSAEVAVVKYEGQGQLNLAGWQLKDDSGNIYTFSQITLYTNGAVQVHTTEGSDTVIDLYWDLTEPVWQSGEDAKLYDPQGNLRAVYKVP
jgi:hypothetical protein